ncbi:DUF4262 domain-containing protein [uncultured Paludibaculum sp.]|uniref:DUF4262 domain-containing protein n=1 Tax=uncultured Paludibaculum sp. TaxID=1765020 RepID=UPI002AAA693D|nr:DUF4262 domain-containing protein [uncultured Paludibaculum sp.]
MAEIRSNIAEYGFHVYVVAGGGVPHYGYTIGLSESLGAELILAGAYFYELDDVAKIIRIVAGELRAPVIERKLYAEDSSWGTFSLRQVHMSWAQGLMLGVFDYYQTKTIAAYQLLPDEEHWTIDIPDLSRTWSPDLAPAWRWLHEPWTFPVPSNSTALTNLDALRGARATEAVRWEEDEWEVFAGAGPDATRAERRVVPLGVLLAADASLLPVVDLPVGSGLWRDAESGWHPWANSEGGDSVA